MTTEQAEETSRKKAAQERQTREILVASRVQKILDDAGVKWDDVRATQVNDLAYRVNVYVDKTTRAEIMGLARIEIVRSYYVIVDAVEMITRSLPPLPRPDPKNATKRRRLTDEELANDTAHRTMAQ